jgi:2-polyprenyl-3-methyl-5-hydroxy-6-metoxy-1,4-benzoquinol methylase
MSWFVNWFDSPYYHLLYKNRDNKEAQVFIDNLVSHLQIPKKSTILDVACGKGRHSIYCNAKGMNVVGIDLSNNSINIAKKNSNKNLQFSVYDMREVFKKNTFDIVINLFTSFGYFEKDEDEQKAINAMACNLKQEGILIIDFMNAKKAIRNLIKYEKKDVNGVTFNISRSIKNNYIIKDITFSNKKENFQFQEKVKALTLTDFSNLIKNAGLKIIDIFGNYKLEDFNALTSERLIIICKK